MESSSPRGHYKVIVTSESPYAFDIMTACLAEIGFESFETNDLTLNAYIPEGLFDAGTLKQTCDKYLSFFPFQYTLHKIPYQNWNRIWESDFKPVTVGDQLRVRAVFHDPDPSIPLEIVIQPKMSFGTGHHATTYLVMELMLGLNFKDRTVLDFGAGTGILGILANKLGAKYVWAVDNDPQCIENAAENFAVIDCQTIHLALGGAEAAGLDLYDIIIANITRNTIVENFEVINLKLQPNGLFIASGFYEEDLKVINKMAAPQKFTLKQWKTMDKWCAAVYQKDMDI